MLPWQRAKQWHDEHCADTAFEELLGTYLSTGYVWSTPQVFLLAKEVYWSEKEMAMYNDIAPNAWFVELGASAEHGNPVREFMRIAPHAHRYALWCRHNSFEIKPHDWGKLARKVGL